MARLTAKGVETARAAEDRRELPDDYMRGLYLVVQPTGSKSWAVRYRHGGRSHKHTVGPYPAFDLKQAREAAAKVLRAVAEGRHPEQRQSGSVADAVAQFIERHCRNYRPKPRSEAERQLRLVVSHLGHRRLIEITRADIRGLLARVEAPIAANRLLSIIRKLFNWAVENDLIASSPVAGLRAPHAETSRDRVLTDDELRRVWQAAEGLGPLNGAVVRLLVLTGQRRNEVAHMQRAELDLEKRLWTLPRERVKNDRRHEVPLSSQAATIIRALPRISERFVFSTNAESPLNDFGKNKRRLDDLSGVSDWVLHDLRRTVASGMARLGISLSVIEKVLNHVSGSFAGIVGVYQRHEFAAEKCEALEKWADHVERLVRP
jgi:integrase